MNYTFERIASCEMCGHDQFKVLGKRLNSSQGKRPSSKMGTTTTVVRCKNCGLIFSNPMPVPGSISDHYAVPPESYWKDDYFKVSEDHYRDEINVLKRFIPSGKVLDVGAGLGKTMIAFERAGYDVYGFEPSEPFRERAISKMGIEPGRIKLAAIETAEYPENEFDFISFGAVLEHLYHPSTALQSAIKWLKPGGLIHLEIPSADWLVHKLINFYYRATGTDYVGNLSPMHVPYHLYEFTVKSFEENGKRNGYSVFRKEFYVIRGYAPRPLELYMKRTNTGMQISVWLMKNKV